MGRTKIDTYKRTYMYRSLSVKEYLLLYLFMEDIFPKPFQSHLQVQVQKLKDRIIREKIVTTDH